MDWDLVSATLQKVVPLLGLNTPVAVGAMIGSGIAFLAGRQPVGVLRRLTNALTGCAFAIYATDGFVELAKVFITVNPTDAMMRLLGMIMGLMGILVCEFFINFGKRMSDNGDDFADALLGGAKDAIKALTDRVRGNPPTPTPVVGSSTDDPGSSTPQPTGGT